MKHHANSVATAKTQKAYKLLAAQENISNNEAKSLIDAGLVSANGKRLSIARSELGLNTSFKINYPNQPKIIFEDDFIMAVNKPAFLTSQMVADKLKFPLLNRLDKETSGVLLLYKNEDFQKRAIKEFEAQRVDKTYLAIINGILAEPLKIELPISTIKANSVATSRIDLKSGKPAITIAEPFLAEGRKSLIKVCIPTGRTHQIRVHLAHAGYGVIGDEKYAKSNSSRLFLHSYETRLFNYIFTAKPDRGFFAFGFSESSI